MFDLFVFGLDVWWLVEFEVGLFVEGIVVFIVVCLLEDLCGEIEFVVL